MTNSNTTPNYTVLAWGASVPGNVAANAATIEKVIEIVGSLDRIGQTAQIFNLSWGHSYVVTWGEEAGGGASAKCFGDNIPEDVLYLLSVFNR